MADADGRSTFEAYLTAVNTRDVTKLEGILHPDFEDFYPQSGERTRGPENLKAIIGNYPETGYTAGETDQVISPEDQWVMTPAMTILRIEGSGNVFIGTQHGKYPDGTTWHIIVIGTLRDGKMWRAESFWAPAFEPPAWRAQWVDVDTSR